jgi:hypothetical protein
MKYTASSRGNVNNRSVKNNTNWYLCIMNSCHLRPSMREAVLPTTAAEYKKAMRLRRTVVSPLPLALQQSCRVVALHDCNNVCTAAKHIIFSILSSVVCIAEHSQGSSPNFPLATKQLYVQNREYSCTVARSHIFTGLEGLSNEDMIADLTTRPGSLWRKLTIHDVVEPGMCPAYYSLDFWVSNSASSHSANPPTGSLPAKPAKLEHS